MTEIAELLKPAVMVGILIGIISEIPFLNLLNCLCCLWIIIAGVISVYLLKKDIKTVDLRDGALVGALTGVVIAVVGTFVGIIVSLLFTQIMMDLVMNMYRSMGVPPSAMSEMSMEPDLNSIIIGFVMRIVLYPIFGAIGGVLGAKLMEK